MTRGRITHITLDGLSTDLGRSQVLAVCERLQSMGWNCTILSLEPESADSRSLERLDHRMAARGLKWHYEPYRSGRLGALENAVTMAGMVQQTWAKTDLFHCRSYFGAFFPAAASALGDVAYVFDTRGYWIDEKVEAGRWFQDRFSLAAARRVERALYNRASAVVSLTELAASDVRMGRFGKQHPSERSVCIPTSVDFVKFRIGKSAPPHDFVRDGPIIAYVGSLNTSYEYRKSVALAARILERERRAKFLALTGQTEAMTSLANQLAIPRDRRLILRVPYDEMHRWLPHIDVGMILRVGFNEANRASMPTKLGEFFATGVAPVTHGANSEVGQWVRRTGSGLALDDLSDASLERAADFVVSGRPSPDALMRARVIAEPHFSLDSAARWYDALFGRILVDDLRLG